MDIIGIFKQVHTIKKTVKRVEAELRDSEVEVSAGDGMVVITMNGVYEGTKLAINAAATKDRALLQDFVLAAVNEAACQVKKMRKEKIKVVLTELGVPDIPGLSSLL